MEKILQDYIGFIKKFENLMIDKYQLKENPFYKAGVLFKKNGVIGEYNYFYHGAGCRLEKKGVICEYDISNFKGKEIEFSLWKFYEFIRTNNSYKEMNYSQEYIEEELLKLIDKKIIQWLIIDNHSYKIYQII